MSREIHVAKTGSLTGDGSLERPYLQIRQAAEAAMPGDTITVHEGIYRERVNPIRGGTSNCRRITYQAAEGETVVIKGSKEIKDWEPAEGTVWKTVIPNHFFGEFNPYKEALFGDWFIDSESGIHGLHMVRRGR